MGRGGLLLQHVPEDVPPVTNRFLQLLDLLLLAPEDILQGLACGLILLKLPSCLCEAALLSIDAISHFDGLSLKLGLVVFILGLPVLRAGKQAELRRVHVPSAAVCQRILLLIH